MGLSLSHLQAVIFDMDGLILDTEFIYRLAWQKAASELNCDLSDSLYLTLVGRSNSDAEAILLNTFGDGFSLPLFRSRWAQCWQEHVQKHGIGMKPGLLELLDLLDEHHIPKAVATSTIWDEAMLSLGELVRCFDSIVTGDQVRRGKPAPDIYLLTASQLQVSAHRCLVLEDSEAGARAACEAGMMTIMVPDLIQPSEEVTAQVYNICSSLHEVRELLMMGGEDGNSGREEWTR
jgi:HAD superfamily hydrolase (TIGR01509 family)